MIKRYIVYTVTATVSLGVLFIFVDPASLPSAALFAVFSLIYVAIATTIIMVMLIVQRFLELKWRTSTIRRVGFSIALLPTFLLLLQSVGQLTIRDALLAMALTILLYVYSRRMFGSPSGVDDTSEK